MITLDALVKYLCDMNLDFEISCNNHRSNPRYSIKVWNYSSTAQPGYEHHLLFNHTGSLQNVIDTTMEWFLPHRRKVLESKR